MARPYSERVDHIQIGWVIIREAGPYSERLNLTQTGLAILKISAILSVWFRRLDNTHRVPKDFPSKNYRIIGHFCKIL